MIELHGTWLEDCEIEERNGLFLWAEKKSTEFHSDYDNPEANSRNHSDGQMENFRKGNSVFLNFNTLKYKLLDIIDANNIALNWEKSELPLTINYDTHNGNTTFLILENMITYNQSNEDLSSNNMISETHIVKQKLSIPCIRLEYYDAIAFLHLLALSDASNRSLILADDLRFWMNQLYFANKLINEEHIYPEITPLSHVWENLNKNSKTYLGWWNFILYLDDYQYFKDQISQIPPLATVFTSETDSSKLIERFIQLTINMIMRSRGEPSEPYLQAILSEISDLQPHRESLLDAFFSFNPIVKLEKHEIEKVRFSFNNFIADVPTYEADNELWQMVLRLVPPESMGIDKWSIEFMMKNKDDSTAIISVQDLFKHIRNKKLHNDSKVYYSKFLFHNPINFFYQKLQELNSIIPFLDKVIRNGASERYQLQREELFALLDLNSSEFKELNSVVLLPKNYEQRLFGKKNTDFEINFSFADKYILDYDISLMLDESDIRIPIDTLIKLASDQERFVEIAGRWIYFDKNKAKKIKNIVKKISNNLTLLDAIRLEAGDTTDIKSELDILDSSIKFRSSVNKTSNYQSIPDQINNFHASLRPYQREGVLWLLELKEWQLSGCLADDMGLGKTIQILAYLQHLKNQRKLQLGKKKFNQLTHLIVVPTSILNNWLNEATKFTPNLSILKHHGGERIKSIQILNSTLKVYDVMITTYGTIYQDYKLLKKISWGSIIIDEAQAIKNHKSKIFKYIKKLDGANRIALTGTPIENNLEELWAIFNFLLPNYLYSIRRFKEVFVTPITEKKDNDKMQLLKRLTDPFIMRRSKTDKEIIDDLPSKVEKLEYCSLTQDQVSLYQATMQSYEKKMQVLPDNELSGLILSTITKLKQICNHPANLIGELDDKTFESGKIQKLTKILDRIIDKNEKALIFTQFKQMGYLIQKYLRNYLNTDIPFISGDVNLNERQEMIDNFNTSIAEYPVMIITIQAGGTGLNLTAANHVIHYDRWWNPSVEQQATDRAFRIGQNKDVTVYKFMTKGTIEERINEIITNKSDLVDRYVSGISKHFSQIDTKQLHELMRLKEISVTS